MASRCLMPKAPCPAMQIFMIAIPSGVFENEMTERRVRRRHVIEAIDLLHPRRQRAARDEPHDHLDALGTGLTHVLDERNLARHFGIARQAVEEALVPLLVDEPGALALQLVRHAARTENDDTQIFRIRLDRAPDRLAEIEAAIAR